MGRITISNSEVHSLTIEAITENRPQSDLLLTIEGSRVVGFGGGPLINIPQGYTANSIIRVRLINNELSKQAQGSGWSLIAVPSGVILEIRNNYIRTLPGFNTIIGLSQDLTSGFYEFSENTVEPMTQPTYLLSGGVAISAPFIISGNKFLAQARLFKVAPTSQAGLSLAGNINLTT
ncbi:hypothetical protein [Vulcanisaeta sp. JCM 16161]|uniref:hypothetical protein n=1 Tax=Vulcanisaeta sp. JCM 16161 TaxID=1295372 RepID=UPI0006D177B3|nr:hypothetical protein [Vulcanisaeta sp. JCM 16161]